MPLHPDAQASLDQRTAAGARPITELTVEEARAQATRMSALLGPGEAVAKVEDRTIVGPMGEIPVRVYTPGEDTPYPVLVFFHGGGWVVGNLETTDQTCRTLTNKAHCMVVSVNYRHAPEHKFPAAAEDSYAATRWVAENAASFGGDPQRIAVGGTSAGGNLAAVVALMARDRGAPALVYQLLIVPVIDYTFDTPSYRDNAESYGLTRDAMLWYWKHYLNEESDGLHGYASPLRAYSLANLPPAFVLTAEYDPLRDEGAAYARRLREAGVEVTHKDYAGMIHGFWGAQAMNDMAQALRAAFAHKD